MSDSDYVLAIDNGTQSIRALVFDSAGNEIAKSKVALEAYFSQHPGWAEQHPDYYWQQLGKACKALWDQGIVTPGQIKGMALTTQRYTMINLDEDKKPLRPAIVWMDQRKAEPEKPVGGLWGLLIRTIGLTSLIEDLRAKARDNWIIQHQPDIWQKTRHYVNLSGYLTYQLTGEMKDACGSVAGYLPYDYRRQKWAGKHDLKWQLLATRRHMLPELVQPGEQLGHITAEAAEHTGLPAGLPMIAASSDKACEVLGAGGVDPHIGCLSFGTTATISTTTSRYFETVPFIPPYTAAMPKRYNTEVMIYRGFWMVSWFKNELAQAEQRKAKELGVEPEQLFDALLTQVPPGSMGLMMQPYWSPGVRQPGPEGKGAFIGFGDVHKRAHIYRAILEGLAYELRSGKEQIEKRSGTPITRLRVSGGGSQSDAAMQLTANIFGMEAERPHTYEASGLGAAINCCVGLGIHKDYNEAIDKMTRVGDVFAPDLPTMQLYDRLYNEVYKKIYKRLQPLYKSIRDITGYPKH
ncbi:FGGY-family carbohydrate kinase [Endozoicomonas sp. GU-1]|uniref:FGGY-family carbohydrate kinase n=1 Tax=Endozoicomonas sp. GU-1 TaxID=3009078 RepID=UPI0022B50AE5|nr:FGGY-family carbohydrate kinase [Endozoicomonas sp. GU-1]WBA83225.1 FGGY-family carbohydrate kinase [Endozoicomonas sp. GU-1]WBA86150.1 FGGY-family carbohydrate kinase [Endozoicomonas sp. GU-1]